MRSRNDWDSVRWLARLATLALLVAASTALRPAIATAQPGFPLVAGGQAADILLGAGAPDGLREAVGDLQRLIEAATGVRPAVRVVTAAEATPWERPAVLVGRRLAGLEPLDERRLGYDGYRIAITAARARLAGANPDGTTNAVYDLLRSGLGVRFLVPGEDGTLVPRQREVILPAVDRRERPAFELRFPWFNHDVLRDASDARRRELRRFVRRNRGMGLHVVLQHYWSQMVPPDRYFADHPEYFAEVGGERRRDGQLCTSQATVIHLAAQHWIERFDREPELRIGSLSPNDGGLYCTCDACRQHSPSLPARLVLFMNEVTRRVTRHQPDRRLSFYAYGPLAEPPHVELHPGLVVTIARYGVCQAHAIDNAACPGNAAFRRRYEGWLEEVSDHLVREYACWWRTPDLATHVLAANLRTYREHGALGVSREYLHRGFGSDLLRYLDLQLMWNPALDPDRLVDEFLEARFGRAAGGVRRVIETYRTLLESTDPQQPVRGSALEIEPVIPVAALRTGVEDLERLARATGGVHGERVAVEAEMLRAALADREVTELTRRYAATGRDDTLERLREALRGAAERCARLQAAGHLGSSWGQHLEQLRRKVEGPGVRAPIDGTFEYEDDMTHGGFARRDAELLEGFYPGQYGLALLPRRSGRVSFSFTAAPGRRFTHGALERLVFKGSDARIEVKVNGAVQVYSDNVRYSDIQQSHDLTPLVAGAERFTLTFRADNRGDRPILCLDNWGIRLQTETE